MTLHDLVHVYLQDASIIQWLKENALGSGSLDSNPGSTTYCLYNWPSYLVTLNLHFPICKMETITF